MKLIAQIEDEEVYLIDLEKDRMGFVYDAIGDVRYSDLNIESILARGSWVGLKDNSSIVNKARNASIKSG